MEILKLIAVQAKVAQYILDNQHLTDKELETHYKILNAIYPLTQVVQYRSPYMGILESAKKEKRKFFWHKWSKK
jgi:hypothetical protein